MASVGGSKRFLPPDPRVEEPYRLTPQLAMRVAMLGFLALAVFAVLFLRLWALEVLAGDRYLAVANDNRVRTLRLDAPRGVVLDRAGRPLVTNVPGTRVELWPADLPKNWPAQRRELRALSRIVDVPTAEILRKMRKHVGDPVTPVVVQTGVHWNQIAYLREHESAFPGIQLGESFLRHYPHQSLAAQVVGYVGEISDKQLAEKRKLGYRLGDTIGQAGIESSYDRYLRGRDGLAQLTVDSRGRPKSDIRQKTFARPGNTLRLTIDIGLQRAAERALTYGIKLAHADGKGFADGGAIVALNPRDGSVLALASNPTFKPNVFVGRPDAKKLAPLLDQSVAAKENYPGLDRAVGVTYPPGSTFKPVTALAALQENVLKPYESLFCSPDYQSPKDEGAVKQTFKNWNPNTFQWMELHTALAASCDTFFYRVGEKFFELPADRGHPLQNWSARFGLGQRTGIDIGPEVDGLIPTPEWRRKAFSGKQYTEVDRTWKPGYSIQLAIGQGDVGVTPLQMTRFYALIANGGKLVTPHIAADVEQPSNDPRTPHVLRRFGSQPARPANVDPSALHVVQQGLFEATHSADGTSAGVFGNFPVAIAGKTGTAEKVVNLPGYPAGHKEDQSWWCGYGPYDDPTIVVCAVIENGGHGGTAAAPAALKVFEQWFGASARTTTHASD